MFTKTLLKKSFTDQVNLMFRDKPKVSRFILNHERVGQCLENLRVEVKKMELSKSTNLKNSHVEMLGKEYAITFSKLALKHQEEQAVNYLKKQRMIDEKKEIDEIMGMFDSEDSSESL